MPYNTYQPSLDPQDSGNLVANWVQLSNVSKKRLKGQLFVHKLDGSQAGKPFAVNLRDGARYDYSAHDYGANNAGLVRFVPDDKMVEYQLRAVRYVYDNAGSEDSFFTAYPFNSLAGSGEALVAPVDTTESSAILEISNTLSKKVSVRLKLYDKSGAKLLYNKAYLLKAYSTMHLPLDSLLTSRQGVVIAKGSHVGGIIGNVVHYGREASGGVRNMYAIELREPIGTALKGSYNTYLDQGCTLYLANAASAKEKVRISMQKSDGTSPVGDYSLTVPAHGALAEDICSKAGKNTYGVVSVTASAPNHIYGVVLRKGAGGRYKMGTGLR